jgi:uncharacterized YccA/Bax inhibitor family protein
VNTSNPAFRDMDKVVAEQRGGGSPAGTPSSEYLQQLYNQPSYRPPLSGVRYMTLDDVVVRTAAVLGAAVITGVLTATLGLGGLLFPALIVGLVLSMVVIVKQSTNPALILGYAVAEGVVLGSITQAFNEVWSGIALQAVVATVGVFAGMLVVYKTGAIKVTPRFTKMLVGAMIGVVVLMLFNLVASLFGANMHLRDGSGLAIIFSLVCIAVAAFSFMLDFDAIDKATKAGVPAKAAWYFAFGLMVTLVWLYLEILQFLAYLRQE